ncbi:MAG: sensor histidine kinase [Lachnospiraceae bacterium]
MKPKRNRLLELISKRKIRQQLYMIYVIAVFFPIAIIGSFLLGTASRLLTNYYKDLLESDNLRVKTILFEITTQIYNISEEISFEDSLQEILGSGERKTEENSAYSYTTIDNYISTHAEIEDITVYTDNPNAAGYMHFEKADEAVQSTEWYERATGQVSAFWIPMEKKDKYGNSYWNLALVRKITVMGSDYQAVLVIQISDNYLQTRIRSNEYRITVSADNKRIFYNSARTGYGEEQTIYIDYTDDYYQYLGPVWENANKLFTKISTLHLYQTDSRIYITTMNETAYGDIQMILIACLLIILVAIAVPAALIHYFTGYFTGRVNVLRNEMKKASNEEYDIPLSFGGEDELSEAFADLQVMVQKIKEKDARVYKARLSEQQLLNEQQLMEMKMLASQINPHFLYNTLESIRMQALTAGNREVANSIKLLGKSMRYVLENTGTSLVSLKKELDYMETYLQIQKIRFGDRINYRIQIEEGLKQEEYMLLPLLLQPIVENAIVHGLEQMEENGQIDIYVEAPEGTSLQITISDNGCGMDEEELENLRIRMSQKTLNRTGSIGLCNINQRIRLYYGDSYGMTIESTPGVGTSIIVKLPVKYKDV